MKQLILIDAMALLYRSYYGIRALSTTDGVPTNAIYGFIRKINEFINRINPSHIAVVFDGGSPDFRMRILPEYKMQRKPMPDDLREQINPLIEYLNAADIFHIKIDHQEADDIMASIATHGYDIFEKIYLATGDKDMMQLINEKVLMLPLAGKTELLDREGVHSKTGVYPKQIVEWLALIGDSADNIPGVPGVGSKTAARLLNEYGNISELKSRFNEIPNGKLKESLENSWDIVERNIELINLDCNVKFDYDWQDMKVAVPDADKLLPILDKFEFKEMARKFREPELF